MSRTLPNALAIALGALLVAALTAGAVAFLSSGDTEPPRLDADAWAAEADGLCTDGKETLAEADEQLADLAPGTLPSDEQVERYAAARAAGYEELVAGLRALEGPEADADDAEQLASAIEDYGGIEARFYAGFVALDIEEGGQPPAELEELQREAGEKATAVASRADELAKSLGAPSCSLTST